MRGLCRLLKTRFVRGFLLRFVWHNFKGTTWWTCRRSWKCALYAPEPTQDIRSENSSTRSGGNASKRLLRAGLAVREAVAADDDGDQGDLGHGAGKEAFGWR